MHYVSRYHQETICNNFKLIFLIMCHNNNGDNEFQLCSLKVLEKIIHKCGVTIIEQIHLKPLRPREMFTVNLSRGL